MAKATSPRTQVWTRHAVPALIVFIAPAILFAFSKLDLALAHIFFSPHDGWIGANSWFVNELIHTGGRWAVRIVAALALLVWLASFFLAALRSVGRPAVYFFSALALTVGIVGLLKTFTNVDCPWDLIAFGGDRPYVGLFSTRPDDLPHARCFPAAHASSGYAFMALYFLAYERSQTWARMGLAVGLILGLVFGIAQQSRGAHLISHDLWSALLGWLIPLTLYAFGFNCRLYDRQHDRST